MFCIFWTVEQSEIKNCMNLNHWFNALSGEHTKCHVSNTPQCYGINRITKCSELKSSQWILSCDFNFFLLCLRTSSFSEVDEDFVLLLFLSNQWHQSLFQLVILGEGGWKDWLYGDSGLVIICNENGQSKIWNKGGQGSQISDRCVKFQVTWCCVFVLIGM